MQCKNQLLPCLVNSNWLAYRYRTNSLSIKFNHCCPVACLQKNFWNNVGIALEQGDFSHVRNASAPDINMRTAVDFYYDF